jgi:hypothetical protein
MQARRVGILGRLGSGPLRWTRRLRNDRGSRAKQDEQQRRRSLGEILHGERVAPRADIRRAIGRGPERRMRSSLVWWMCEHDMTSIFSTPHRSRLHISLSFLDGGGRKLGSVCYCERRRHIAETLLFGCVVCLGGEEAATGDRFSRGYSHGRSSIVGLRRSCEAMPLTRAGTAPANQKLPCCACSVN